MSKTKRQTLDRKQARRAKQRIRFGGCPVAKTKRELRSDELTQLYIKEHRNTHNTNTQ